jgi:DNA-binding HxlR family transcriptional regulator
MSLDLERTRAAIENSTLSQALTLVGDPWVVAILLGAFTGIRHFDQFHLVLGIPRLTLTQRLRTLVQKGMLNAREYQASPRRVTYHLTKKSMALYPHTLMVWEWERRWGTRRSALPAKLTHLPCNANFRPQLVCEYCRRKVKLRDLLLTLNPGSGSAPRRERAVRLQQGGQGFGLNLDRWALLIITAVYLGCHSFQQLSLVLGIGSSVLARRLAALVASSLLLCQSDLSDSRRKIYRLTPASNDLFAPIVTLSAWATAHFATTGQTIRPRHKDCGHTFEPRVECDHCSELLSAFEVQPG